MVKSETKKVNKILVSIYSDEIETVVNKLKESGQQLLGSDLNSRDVRAFLNLKPTHRTAFKTELRKAIGDLSLEEQQELLNKIKGKQEE